MDTENNVALTRFSTWLWAVYQLNSFKICGGKPMIELTYVSAPVIHPDWSRHMSGSWREFRSACRALPVKLAGEK